MFNLEQTEGITRPEDDLSCERKGRLDQAEGFLAKLPKGTAAIAHGVHFSPSYAPLADLIQLPHLSQFESAEHYYSTLFHELVHSTGPPSRLNRLKAGPRGGEAYSFEELVAELGAAFLCAITGIESQRSISEQAAYIHGWKEFLKLGFILGASGSPRAGLGEQLFWGSM